MKQRKQRANQQKYRKLNIEKEQLIEQLIRHYLNPEQMSWYLKNTSSNIHQP
ncbi:MAG: hypothetical protein ACN4GR_16040 [Arenicellales bacterium]